MKKYVDVVGYTYLYLPDVRTPSILHVRIVGS